MANPDSRAFGRRVKERRLELGLSEAKLGSLAGYSQQRIGSLEAGQVKKPERAALPLAKALQTTPEWLLWAEGPKAVGNGYLTTRQIAQVYDELSPVEKANISQIIKNTAFSGKRSKAG